MDYKLLRMQHNIGSPPISQTMLTDGSEQLYHPASVTVFGGETIWALKELSTIDINPDEYTSTLLRNCAEEHR